MAEVELNRDNKLCASCQLPCGLFCTRCRVTPYCSVECQKDSWPMHKKACKLNNPTPSADSVAVIEGFEDFDRLYSYIIISGANKGAENTLLDTIARLKGKKPDPLVFRIIICFFFITSVSSTFQFSVYVRCKRLQSS